MMFHPTTIWRSSHLLLAVAVAACGSLSAKVITDGPKEMQGVGVDEMLGNQVSLDLKFRDHHGLPLTLEKIFDGQRPVILSLNYSDCPMLCRYQLNGLVDTLKEMPWNAGQEFDVVSVSIDPTERPERARQTHKRYVQDYGRPGAADGWHFLVGDSQNIAQLADEVGFRYNYVEDTGEYVHTAALMVMTPDGVVSRYLYGVMYDPQTMRLSLVEAGDGKVGSAMDQILLTCFIYDHTKGRYGPHAFRLMQVGAGTTVVVLGLALVPFWLRRRSAAPHASTPTGTPDTPSQQLELPDTSSREGL